MAESSLSIGWPELQQSVGFFLGYGRTIGDWSVAHLAEIALNVQSGVRRVYYPMNGEGYEWSFLRPTKTLAIVTDDGDYDLPDDFGRLIGDLHFAADTNRIGIARISVGRLLELRSRSDRNDAPVYVAIRYKESDGSGGQRQEALFWPEPSEDWTLSYEYEAYSGELSDTYPYPLGGMQLAELYTESCLAVAEQRVNNEAGLHTQAYQALLVDAIARDKKRGAKIFGQMGHVELYYARPLHGMTSSPYPITYRGMDL